MNVSSKFLYFCINFVLPITLTARKFMVQAAYFTYTRNQYGSFVIARHLLELKQLFERNNDALCNWESRRPPADHVKTLLKSELADMSFKSKPISTESVDILPGLGDAELAISFNLLAPESRTALHLMGRSAWERREFLHQILTASLHTQIDYLALAVLNEHGRNSVPHFTLVCNYLKVLYRDPKQFRLPLEGLLVIGYGPVGEEKARKQETKAPEIKQKPTTVRPKKKS